LIVDPELEVAPEILPILVPNVHEKLLDAVAVRPILGLAPLHIVAVVELVITGIGLTVTVIEVALPPQPCVETGVTI
jgi:hypothetical protein